MEFVGLREETQNMLAVRMGGQLYGLVPMGRGQGLNQTYGWGTESGDSFGSGTVSCTMAGATALLACLLVFRAALRVLVLASA